MATPDISIMRVVEDDGYWSLQFSFCWDRIRFSYTIDGPYCYTQKEWLDLARGIHSSINCLTLTKNKSICFETFSPGLGITAEFEVPLKLISRLLINTITQSVAEGLRFA